MRVKAKSLVKFELNSSVTGVYQLVVVLCMIATTVETYENEFPYIILLPAATFYQVGRDSCPHIARTQPAVLLFAPSISLMTVLPGLIMSEDRWNALYSAQFPQYGRKKWKRSTFLSLLGFNISFLHHVLQEENMRFWYARIHISNLCLHVHVLTCFM